MKIKWIDLVERLSNILELMSQLNRLEFLHGKTNIIIINEGKNNDSFSGSFHLKMRYKGFSKLETDKFYLKYVFFIIFKYVSHEKDRTY